MHERSTWRSRARAGSVPRYRVAVHGHQGSASARGSVSRWFAFLEFRAEGSDARVAGVLVSFEYDQLRLLVYQFGPGGGKKCRM